MGRGTVCGTAALSLHQKSEIVSSELTDAVQLECRCQMMTIF